MPGRGDGKGKGRERLRVWGPRACCARWGCSTSGPGLGHKTISWHVGDRQKNESGWRQAIRSQGEKDIMQRAGKRSRREEGTANMDSSLKRFDWERNRERFC